MASSNVQNGGVDGMTQIQAVGGQVWVHRDHVGFVIGPKYRALNDVARRTKTKIMVNDHDKQSTFVQFMIGGRSCEGCRRGSPEIDVDCDACRGGNTKGGDEPTEQQVPDFPNGSI